MNSKISCNFLLIVLTVDILASTGDTVNTWLSPTYPKLYSNDTSINPFGRPITPEEDGWIGSLLNVGSMMGPLPFGYIAGRFGRKIGLLSLAVPHIISFTILAFAKHVYLYYIARLLAGLSVGGGYSLLPIYIAEITENSNRGRMSATLNIFWTFGNLISLLLGPFLNLMWFNLVLALLPTTFFILFFIIGTETPYYLVGKNKMTIAENSLKKLRSNQEHIKQELEQIKKSIENEEEGTFLDILKTKALQRGLIISMILVTVQQMSGFKAIMFYLQFIFDSTGSNLPSEISAIIFGLVLFATSFLTPFLSDRWGRKVLLIISCIGMGIAHIILGTFFYLMNITGTDTKPISWLPLLGLICYISFFNFGIGSVTWTLSAELFPSHVRSIAASVVSSFCWIVAFIVTKFFNDMKIGLGEHGTFWLFGVCCMIGAAFCFFCVPETKGKSFNEIQKMLVKEKKLDQIELT